MAETETAAVGVVNGGPALGGFSKEKLVEFLRQMLLCRRFEEKAEEAYAIGQIGGFCHLHIGQEGAAAGCILPLRPDDYVISSYRSHTQALAKGVSPEAVMSELYGKATGTSGGKPPGLPYAVVWHCRQSASSAFPFSSRESIA